MKRKILKILIKHYSFLRKIGIVSSKRYMRKITKYYSKLGIKFSGKPNWINPDVYFDGREYSLISIGNNVTLSREVMFLVHDYSVYHVAKNLNKMDFNNNSKILFLKEISIGDNTFIGARASLLPGTKIGKNCIIGSCAVVKGEIPDNSIVIGNPSRIVTNVNDWIDKELDKKLYVEE